MAETSNLNPADIARIDQRIRYMVGTTRAVGVCVDRDSVGPGAQVLFDGSTVAMPVKVLGNVSLQPDIRCVLDKYGTDWFVTGAWSAFQLGEASYHNVGSTSESPGTSGVYVDLAQVTPRNFTKYYAATYVRMAIRATAFATTAAAELRFGIRLIPQSGQNFTAADHNVTYFFYNNTVLGTHLPNIGWARYTNIPAGDYTWQVRWRRAGGTGTFTFNTDDEISVELDEGVRSGFPVL